VFRISVASLVAVSADAAHRRSLKVMAILVVVFHPVKGINIGLLNVHSVKGEMFEIFAKTVLCSVQKYKMVQKTVSFCADFAGAPRQ
jgi:hypothetical protein